MCSVYNFAPTPPLVLHEVQSHPSPEAPSVRVSIFPSTSHPACPPCKSGRGHVPTFQTPTASQASSGIARILYYTSLSTCLSPCLCILSSNQWVPDGCPMGTSLDLPTLYRKFPPQGGLSGTTQHKLSISQTLKLTKRLLFLS